MDFAAARRKMVASQVRTNRVTDPLVSSAMEAVPREYFVPAERRSVAYLDEDQPLGNGRYIMEPMALGRLLQLADVEPGDKALVVAAGTGYSAAVLARMAESVVVLENDTSFAEKASKIMTELVIPNVTVVRGDLASGVPAKAPFDVILIDGAVNEIPMALKQQLRDGGRLVAVVRSGPVGRATLVTRIGDAWGSRTDFDLIMAYLPEFAPQPKFVF
jgi:protein-L-isoaspartate(D-aspartate) O-methyltransferase